VTLRISATTIYAASAILFSLFAWHGPTIASVCVRHERDEEFVVLVTLRGAKADAVRSQILRQLTAETDPDLPDW